MALPPLQMPAKLAPLKSPPVISSLAVPTEGSPLMTRRRSLSAANAIRTREIALLSAESAREREESAALISEEPRPSHTVSPRGRDSIIPERRLSIITGPNLNTVKTTTTTTGGESSPFMSPRMSAKPLKKQSSTASLPLSFKAGRDSAVSNQASPQGHTNLAIELAKKEKDVRASSANSSSNVIGELVSPAKNKAGEVNLLRRAMELSPEDRAVSLAASSLPRFDVYPETEHTLLPKSNLKKLSAQIKLLIAYPDLFEKQYPVIVPFVEGEAAISKILAQYPSRIGMPFRINLPLLNSENIRTFLLHVSRVGDLRALKAVCKSPAVNLEDADDEGRTALIFSAIGGHVPCVRFLLACGSFLNRQDKCGRSSLHWAAYHGHLAVIKELCDHRPDASMEDYLGKTAIHCATYPESSECLEFLIKFCEPIARRGTLQLLTRRKTIALGVISPEDRNSPSNAMDLEGMTPLMWAAFYGHEKHIEVLLGHTRTSAFLQDAEGKTCLHWTVANRHARCVSVLLTRFPALLHVTDKLGRVALHVAAGLGNPAVVEMILKAPGATVNAIDTVKRTPLHWAAAKGHVSIINLLCRYGASVDQLDEHGASPLNYAIQQKRFDCIHVIVRKGAPVNGTDTSGRVPLMWACLQGSPEIVRMLLRANAKIVYRDKTGFTALHMAAFSGDMACCTAIIKAGGDLNMKDRNGQSPVFKATLMGWETIVLHFINEGAIIDDDDSFGRNLAHFAARGGYSSIMQALLSHGVPINARDNNGRTPLHEAAFNGHDETVKLLVKNQADMDIQDTAGETPLHLGALKGHPGVCRILLESGAAPNIRDKVNIYKGKTALDYARNESHPQEFIALLRSGNCRSANYIAIEAARTIQTVWRTYWQRLSEGLVLERRDEEAYFKSRP